MTAGVGLSLRESVPQACKEKTPQGQTTYGGDKAMGYAISPLCVAEELMRGPIIDYSSTLWLERSAVKSSQKGAGQATGRMSMDKFYASTSFGPHVFLRI